MKKRSTYKTKNKNNITNHYFFLDILGPMLFIQI